MNAIKITVNSAPTNIPFAKKHLSIHVKRCINALLMGIRLSQIKLKVAL